MSDNSLYRTITEGWQRHVKDENGVVKKALEHAQLHDKKQIEGDIPGECFINY